MGFHSTLLADLHLIVTIVEGSLDDRDMHDHVLLLNEQARHLEGALELADCRGILDMSDVTVRGTAHSAGLEDREGRAKGGKLAIVVRDELTFGMARVFGAIAARGREVEVTYDLGAALAWLGVAHQTERIAALLPEVPNQSRTGEGRP